MAAAPFARGGSDRDDVGVILDANAVIALLEKAGANAASVRAAMAGRTPILVAVVVDEYLARGDPRALERFIADTGARIVPNPGVDSTAVRLFTAAGAKTNDALIAAVALEAGTQVITFDTRFARAVSRVAPLVIHLKWR